MSMFNSAVLTTKGNELLIKAVAGKQIEFTRLVTGCGIYTEEEKGRAALEQLTELKQQQQEFPFSSQERPSEKCVVLTALITNKDLAEGYKITELGVYGKVVGSDEEFLCSIAVTRSLEETDSFPPYNGLRECQIIQDYYITISPDAEVTINTQGAVALAEDLIKLKAEMDNVRQVIVGTKDELVKSNSILLETIEGTDRIFRVREKDGDGNILIHELAAVFEVPEVRARIQSGDAIGNLIGNIVRYLLDLKPNAFKDADNPFTIMREDTYIPPSERTEGCLYGLVTRQRGLTVINFDRYVQGDENPRQSRTLYGIETTDRTEAETSDSPYKAILRSIVHVEEGDTAQREPNKLYAVTKAQRG